MNSTFARKQEISNSGNNPIPQPNLADTTSIGGGSNMTGRSYVTGKPSAMASFQDREVNDEEEDGQGELMDEDEDEYGMP